MSTLLLNNFNGSFADEVPSVTWTGISGAPQISAATAAFGSSSLMVPESGGASRVLTNAITSYVSGDWTVEGWVYLGGAATSSVTFQGRIASDFDDGWFFEVVRSGSSGWINVILRTGIGDIFNGFLYPAISAGTWYHWAIVRNVAAVSYSIYFNGVRQGSVASPTDLLDASRFSITGSGTSGGQQFADSVRVKNEAVYSGSTYTVPISEFTLGTTTNVETFSLEFDREHSTGSGSLNLGVQSSEFDLESEEARIVLTQSDPQSQYGYEADSPSVTFTYVLATDGAETGWEASRTQDAIPGGMEYDWEGRSVIIPTDYFIGANQTPVERIWEASSPGLFTKGFLRGVTPHRRRIIAGRASIGRRIDPQDHPEIVPSRRTEIVRVLR